MQCCQLIPIESLANIFEINSFFIVAAIFEIRQTNLKVVDTICLKMSDRII